MQPDVLKLLLDMKAAAKRIARFADAKTFHDYTRDDMLRSAVERQFAIIGEAMTRLMKTHRPVAERISEFRQIAGYRHALIHGYDAIDDYVSWGIITRKLPTLRRELDELLGE